MPDPITARHRVAEWHRTGDLGVLWPDVPAAALAAAHSELRVVTEGVLLGSDERPMLSGANDSGARALGAAAFMAGMGGLVGWWIEQGRIDAPSPSRERFAQHLDHSRRRAALLHGELARVIAALQEEGVDLLVLKGIHTGVVYFPDPGTRPAADLDVLIRPEERSLAAAALSRAGFIEARRTTFGARSEWTFGPQRVHSVELEHPDNPWSVDLHTSLERWYFRGVRRSLGEEVFERTGEIRIADQQARVLGQPDLCAFLALHASYELVKVRLIRLVELALVARHDTRQATLDWDELLGHVRRTRTERFVYPAWALVEDLLPDTVPPTVLDELARAATPRQLRVVAAVRAADFAPLTRRSVDAKLMWAAGPRELLLNISELLLPSDDGRDVGAFHRERLRSLFSGKARWRAAPSACYLLPLCPPLSARSTRQHVASTSVSASGGAARRSGGPCAGA